MRYVVFIQMQLLGEDAERHGLVVVLVTVVHDNANNVIISRGGFVKLQLLQKLCEEHKEQTAKNGILKGLVLVIRVGYLPYKQ